MASFCDSLIQRFKQGSIVTRLIYINVIIFLVLRLSLYIFSRFHLEGNVIMQFLQMPSEWVSIATRPWTILTYMFVHLDFWHLFMNMLWMYFFGEMFLRWFNSRQLGGLYILGGLVGGLFFAFFFNLLPIREGEANTCYLMGASAAVLALGIAVAFFRPNEPIRLFLLGTLKLKYLAVIMIVLDMLSLDSNNAGGSLAHLGGALTGLVFGFSLRKGVDLTVWINPCLDWFANLIPSRRRKIKTAYRRSKNEQANKTGDLDNGNQNHKEKETDRLDIILDKIKESGYESLSETEKQQLFKYSRK